MFASLNTAKRREIEICTELLNKRRKSAGVTLVDKWFSGIPVNTLAEDYGSCPRTTIARVKEAVAEMILDSKDTAFDNVILFGYSENLRHLIELRSQLQYKYKHCFQAVTGDGGIADLEEDVSDKQEIIKVNDSINRTLNLMSLWRSKVSGRAISPDKRKDLIAQIVAALGTIIMDMNRGKSINKLL